MTMNDGRGNGCVRSSCPSWRRTPWTRYKNIRTLRAQRQNTFSWRSSSWCVYGRGYVSVRCLIVEQAITRLGAGDVDIIVKDILSRLPCYRGDSRGDELLQVILDKATTLLQTRSNDPVQLQVALHYLSVAQMATVDLHATPAVKLLQFYISALTRKLVLQKFPPEDRIRVISWIMEALSVSERETATQTQQITQLRRQIVDASSMLLEVSPAFIHRIS